MLVHYTFGVDYVYHIGKSAQRAKEHAGHAFIQFVCDEDDLTKTLNLEVRKFVSEKQEQLASDHLGIECSRLVIKNLSEKNAIYVRDMPVEWCLKNLTLRQLFTVLESLKVGSTLSSLFR